jgi:high affinity Mn2+ porin
VPLEDHQATTPVPAAPPAPPPSAATAALDWGDFSLGAEVGDAVAQAGSTVLSPSPSRSTDEAGTLLGGVRIGYGHRIGSHAFLGVEGDIVVPYFTSDGAVLSRPVPQGTVAQKIDFLSTIRGRAGYAHGPWLFYGTGGLAWAQARFDESFAASGASSTQLRWPVGWTAGAGAELTIARRWSVSAEYRFARLGSATGISPTGVGDQLSGASLHGVLLGLTWHFGSETSSPAWWPKPEDWNVHGQVTFIEQGHFGFRSPYAGPNSFSASTQFANTMSATLFLGMRLWPGAALYFNPEIDQGFGLSHTLGLAAFPNGEAQKASYVVPRLNVDRLMVRQTFGLGGAWAVVEDGPNQLPETRDVSRVTITLGRLSVGDAFGLNVYAADPRTQFLNWNVYGGGSYDWTMDQPGFTWGALVELNQPRWAVRAGYFLEPTVSNGNTFDTNIPAHGQYLIEPELRWSTSSGSGIARLLLWVTRANMGSYAAALAMPRATPGYPDITQTRETRVTYGFVASVEQALSRDVGVFSRVSWTPGLVEVMGWTDCDESFSLGAQITGTAWRRPDDRLGLAGVVEGLSAQARAYFTAGGTGILIGDRRLDYRPETVLEIYYALAVLKWATLSLDYQIVANPAYNADRAPVPIYAVRLHAER